MTSELTPENRALIDEAIKEQPPTDYEYVAQNAQVERTRRIGYARTIARRVLLLAARDQGRGGFRSPPPRLYDPSRPDAKIQEAFSFEGGSLTVQVQGYGEANGTGWFCFHEDDMAWEQDQETGKTYVVSKCDLSEFIALRDKLNDLWPPVVKAAAPPPIGDRLDVLDEKRLRHALKVWLDAMETGRSEPLFVARDHTLRLLEDHPQPSNGKTP